MRHIRTVILTLLALPFAAAQAQPADIATQCEDTCRHIHGIDISRYQGEVFWEHIGANSKAAYVYIKATEGGDLVDRTYSRNISMAREHGLKVGSYHFFRPKTDLEQQTRNFTAQCRPESQGLIPMIDIESTGGLKTEEFLDSLRRFLTLIEKAYGQKPLLYTFTNFYNKHLVGQIDGYPLMIAQYSTQEPQLADERDYTMWQYTAKGRIKGINAYVDKSRLMGRHSMRELRFRRKPVSERRQMTEIIDTIE